MKKLFYLKAAKNHNEAMVLGNGRLGATVYGGVNEDVYGLNDDTLWSGYPRDYTKYGAEALQEMQRLILAGDVTATEKTAYEKLYGPWCQSYLPAGNLVIKGDYGEVKDYKRTLSLDNAIHTTVFDGYIREAFASYPDDVICIRYSGKLPTLEISLDSVLRSKCYVENATLVLDGEAPGDAVPHHYDPNDPHKYHGDPKNYMEYETRHVYSDDPKEKGMRYGIGVRIKTDGCILEGEDSITVSGASHLELYVTVKTSFAGYDKHPYTDGIDYKRILTDILDVATKKTYESIKERHIADYSNLYGRMEFDLEGGRDDLPTDERLARHTSDASDLSFYALMYQYGRYLTIASSRKGTQATNLQGIWNVLPSPPWCSSYTTNINTQMNYWGTCGANLSECCEPLHQLIFEVAESGKNTARDLFGAEGFCVNHNIDIWRMTHPAGEWRPDGAKFAYFPVAGAWMTRHLYEYYLETKDLDFLNGKAFDAIMGSARFCDSMLIEQNDKLLFCPATSPENAYIIDGKRFGMSPSTAMFQSIVRDAFEICIACCEITKRDIDYADYLKRRLEKLLWLEISDDGRIVEFDRDDRKSEREVHHRHISHLYSFYPAKHVKEQALFDACKRSLEVRGEDSTGWSSAWKTCIWATFGDGDHALSVCNSLIRYVSPEEYEGRGGIYPNLLCACPPFQIDGNFGYLAAINEMLACEKDGEVKLLPALPALWKNGRIKGLRVNGTTVNIEWNDGKIVSSSMVVE